MDENTMWQKLAAEFLGTAFLVFVGVGSVPALLLVNKANGSTFSGSDLGIISLAFASIVIVTVYVFGYISGNHINPAVTLGLAATGKFPWSEVPSYVAAQVAGAVAGAFAIVGVLGNGRERHRARRRVVRRRDPWYQAFFAEFIGTFLLVFAVFGVIYRKAAPGWAGLAIGMMVFAAIIPVAPDHRRLDQPGAHHRPDDRPADHRRTASTGSSGPCTSSPSSRPVSRPPSLFGFIAHTAQDERRERVPPRPLYLRRSET